MYESLHRGAPGAWEGGGRGVTGQLPLKGRRVWNRTKFPKGMCVCERECWVLGYLVQVVQQTILFLQSLV